MSPMAPTWPQPSHPDIQEVIINEQEFTSKSLSQVSLPPFAFYAKMAFPPCTWAEEPTYATVQIDQTRHLNLNSDLLYINHCCEPSLIFDTANLNILAGPNGLQAGEELTFFYPSTEWYMAQPFDCLCGKPSCRGRISGARDMSLEQLQGLWINGHIRKLLEQRATDNGRSSGNGSDTTKAGSVAVEDPTAQALRDALRYAEKVVEAARAALLSYVESSQSGHKASAYSSGHTASNGKDPRQTGANSGNDAGTAIGLARHGPTSRELSGEMGGDTISV